MSKTPVIKSIKPFIMFDLPETPIGLTQINQELKFLAQS